MNRFGWFVLGVIVILAIEGIGAGVIVSRAHGWSAQEDPTGLEKWIARRAREAGIPENAKKQANPVAARTCAPGRYRT